MQMQSTLFGSHPRPFRIGPHCVWEATSPPTPHWLALRVHHRELLAVPWMACLCASGSSSLFHSSLPNQVSSSGSLPRTPSWAKCPLAVLSQCPVDISSHHSPYLPDHQSEPLSFPRDLLCAIPIATSHIRQWSPWRVTSPYLDVSNDSPKNKCKIAH